MKFYFIPLCLVFFHVNQPGFFMKSLLQFFNLHWPTIQFLFYNHLITLLLLLKIRFSYIYSYIEIFTNILVNYTRRTTKCGGLYPLIRTDIRQNIWGFIQQIIILRIPVICRYALYSQTDCIFYCETFVFENVIWLKINPFPRSTVSSIFRSIRFNFIQYVSNLSNYY